MKTLKISIWVSTLTLLFAIGTIHGQLTYNPKALVPLDPAYKTGTLANGIKYIIRGDLSEKNAYFYGYYNIGSIQEEKNEYGLAHLIEHLCFNGKNDYINYFKFKGMDMGQHINAGTGPEKTVFKVFKVPSEKNGMIDTALLLIKDLCFKLNIKPEDLDKERKVVLEEWRLNNDAAGRIDDKFKSTILEGTRYVRPSILGDTAAINHCTVNDLGNFFNKWYRPDHLTIIALGGFDADKMEKKIRQLYNHVPKAEGQSPRVFYPVPDNKAPVIQIISDPQTTTKEIEIRYKHDKPGVYNQEQLRTQYVDMLINNMFQNRLDKIAGSADAPFRNAYASYDINYFQTPSYDAYSYNIIANRDVKAALSSILTENERIMRQGFTKPELENAKKAMSFIYGPGRKETKFPYSEYMAQLHYYILKGKILPSFNYKRNFVKSVFPAITLEEAKQRFKTYTSNIEPVISILCPQMDSATIPTVSDIKTILASMPLQKIGPYVNTIHSGKLFEKKVIPGVVKKETKNVEMGTTEWTLSNGMRVIIKQSDFNPGDIQFMCFLNNDKLGLKEEYWGTSVYGGLALKNMGVDKFTDYELKQILNGKTVSVVPELNNPSSGIIHGNSTPKDFETALQLVNLHYSNPRFDENALTNEVDFAKSLKIKNPSRAAFYDTVYNYVHRKIVKNTFSFDSGSVTLDKLKMIHRAFFKNPSAFTFIFVGDLNSEKIKPLIEKYLGSLTADKDAEMQPDIFNSDVSKKTVEDQVPWYQVGRKSFDFSYPMQSPSATVFNCSQGKVTEKPVNLIYGEMTQTLLTNQCASAIRGKFAASYRVTSYVKFLEDGFFHCSVYFQTDPKLVDKMKDVAFEETKNFMEGNNTREEDFNILKSTIINRRTNELKSNKWWVEKGLKEYYLNHKNIVTEYLDMAKKVSFQELKIFTKSIYEQGNTVDGVMRPQ